MNPNLHKSVDMQGAEAGVQLTASSSERLAERSGATADCKCHSQQMQKHSAVLRLVA